MQKYALAPFKISHQDNQAPIICAPLLLCTALWTKTAVFSLSYLHLRIFINFVNHNAEYGFLTEQKFIFISITSLLQLWNNWNMGNKYRMHVSTFCCFCDQLTHFDCSYSLWTRENLPYHVNWSLKFVDMREMFTSSQEQNKV